MLSPPTTIADVVALARGAAVMVSGDTGPTHIGAAVGTPIVGIYGPTRPERNGPWLPATSRCRGPTAVSVTTCAAAARDDVPAGHRGREVLEAVERRLAAGRGDSCSDLARAACARARSALVFGVAASLAGAADARVDRCCGGAIACGRAKRCGFWAAGHLHKSREVTSSGPYRWLAHPLYVGLVGDGRRPGRRVGQPDRGAADRASIWRRRSPPRSGTRKPFCGSRFGDATIATVRGRSRAERPRAASAFAAAIANRRAPRRSQDSSPLSCCSR